MLNSHQMHPLKAHQNSAYAYLHRRENTIQVHE